MTQFDTWVPIDKTTSGAHSSYIQYYRKWHKCSQKVFFEPSCLFSPPRHYLQVACMVNTKLQFQTKECINNVIITCLHLKDSHGYEKYFGKIPDRFSQNNTGIHSNVTFLSSRYSFTRQDWDKYICFLCIFTLNIPFNGNFVINRLFFWFFFLKQVYFNKMNGTNVTFN